MRYKNWMSIGKQNLGWCSQRFLASAKVIVDILPSYDTFISGFGGIIKEFNTGQKGFVWDVAPEVLGIV